MPSSVPAGFADGAPDAVFEVLSPDDRAAEIRSKVADYLGGSASVVVLVDPVARQVDVHRRKAFPQRLGDADTLDLDDVVDGLRLAVGDIFR